MEADSQFVWIVRENLTSELLEQDAGHLKLTSAITRLEKLQLQILIHFTDIKDCLFQLLATKIRTSLLVDRLISDKDDIQNDLLSDWLGNSRTYLSCYLRLKTFFDLYPIILKN